MPQVLVSDADGDGVFVASDTRTTVYGAGATAEAALADYWSNVESDRSFLGENEATLGLALVDELAALRTHLPPFKPSTKIPPADQVKRLTRPGVRRAK